jgi:hypothetical protein
MFRNVSTFSLRFDAIDSSVSPERNVYGLVPDPPCFLARISTRPRVVLPPEARLLSLGPFFFFPKNCRKNWPRLLNEVVVMKVVIRCRRRLFFFFFFFFSRFSNSFVIKKGVVFGFRSLFRARLRHKTRVYTHKERERERERERACTTTTLS